MDAWAVARAGCGRSASTNSVGIATFAPAVGRRTYIAALGWLARWCLEGGGTGKPSSNGAADHSGEGVAHCRKGEPKRAADAHRAFYSHGAA